jgi:hypothetical protein
LGPRAEKANAYQLEYQLEATTDSGLPVLGHVILLPRIGKTLTTAAGRNVTLGSQPLALSSGELGNWLAHGGWRLHVPDGASLRWPVLPHNPYRKDGRAEPSEGRIVVQVPFDREHARQRFLIEVAGSSRK